ncbi:restriction endonuclease subunit S [Canibacter sp. lx-45]|uniref:restriction endonuclease subunit S n=1 Tax=Canibacter zhuwentaonis TaxID=2837491 RepID=UPI001BDBB827|nr:restriction endonuclease subunit S [Canibacter zhuwentaonis]MBT1034934.1 restriction endonuclease subunit S [Canibacter zhuwentaonis]
MSQNNAPAIRFQGFHEEWIQSQLGNLIALGCSGGTPTATNPSYYNGHIPFLGISDIKDRFIRSTAKHITDAGLNNSAAWIAPKGSISLAMYASVGKVGILDIDAATSQAFYNMVFSSAGTRDFIYARLKNAELGLEWEPYISTGTQRNLNAEKVKSFPLFVPSLKEQEAIGSLFHKLDDLLDASAKKIEKLKQLKTTMLTKMFPQGDSRVPEIRFSGFQDEWKKWDFSSFFKFGRSVPVTRANLNEKAGNALSVHYGDILTSLPNLVDVSSQKLPFINDPELVSRLFSKQLLNGDVVMADTAEDESVGRCAELRIRGELPVFGGLHTYVLHPLIECAEGFLGVLMNSALVHSQIVHFSQGTKVTSVSKEALSGLLLLIPSLSEQEGISNYFRELDILINFELEKLEKLHHLKSAFLASMFV